MTFIYIYVVILITFIVNGENHNDIEDLREKVKPYYIVFDANSL